MIEEYTYKRSTGAHSRPNMAITGHRFEFVCAIHGMKTSDLKPIMYMTAGLTILLLCHSFTTSLIAVRAVFMKSDNSDRSWMVLVKPSHKRLDSWMTASGEMLDSCRAAPGKPQ